MQHQMYEVAMENREVLLGMKETVSFEIVDDELLMRAIATIQWENQELRD